MIVLSPFYFPTGRAGLSDSSRNIDIFSVVRPLANFIHHARMENDTGVRKGLDEDLTNADVGHVEGRTDQFHVPRSKKLATFLTVL